MAHEEHEHDYLLDNARIHRNEKRTLWVVVLTAAMMAVEITFGYITSSMALLADGWHMASHAGALFITFLAYKLAKSKRITQHFTFGAGKFIPLGGYTSAVVLAIIAFWMAIESIQRLFSPHAIRFNEAITVACVGLAVNILSAFILREFDEDSHNHEGHVHDHNIRSAYVHVLADALTSVFAIFALTLGKYLNMGWFDPVMGIVGGAIILKWAYNLCRNSAWELLDGHAKLVDQKTIRALIEDDKTQVTDLHVWRVAPKAHACEMVIHTKDPKGAGHYRSLLAGHFDIKHLTIEECVA